MSDDLHSVRHDLWNQLKRPAAGQEPVGEPVAETRTELEQIRDSVFSEPGHGDAGNTARKDWLKDQVARTSRSAVLGWSAAAALGGGLFAVAGALVVHLIIPTESVIGLLNILLFGPVTEELLKIAGVLFLLEKKPALVRGSWQIVLITLGSAATFAALENLLYIHVYVRPEAVIDHAGFAAFRWVVPSAMHLACSAIAALGLRRVWKMQMTTGESADLDRAFPLVATAMILHGSYNLLAVLLDHSLFGG